MTGIGAPELLILSVLGLLLPLVVGYWVIRLAVRHGVMDAQRRLPGSALHGHAASHLRHEVTSE